MTDEKVWAFVTLADANTVRVKTTNADRIDELLKLGFSFDNSVSEYATTVMNDTEKATLFDQLRQLEVSFSAGREWSPSEVFEHLREQGLLSGKYKRISWSSPHKYNVTAA